MTTDKPFESIQEVETAEDAEPRIMGVKTPEENNENIETKTER